MLDILLSFVAPHLCSGCGKSGTLLCANCKYNIIIDAKSICLMCRKPCGATGICGACRVPFDRAWCVGERTDALQRLIGLYKFERTKSAYKDIGDLLLDTLPELPLNTIVIPVPTVRSHIRERGYDHALLIARYVAKNRGLRLSQVLARVTHTTQRHASATQREQQARQAFIVQGKIEPNCPYLLIDDVVTTGSTVRYTAKALKAAGVKEVWVAVIARQTLDETPVI